MGEDYASTQFVVYPIGVRLLRCSFYSQGQFQGLQWWDEQQVQALTLFHLYTIYP